MTESSDTTAPEGVTDMASTQTSPIIPQQLTKADIDRDYYLLTLLRPYIKD